MGGFLQLRIPSQRLGFDDVILVPHEDVEKTARQVLEAPQLNTETSVRAACIWLRNNGDWMDQDRARHLLTVLDRARQKQALDAWSRERNLRDVKIVGLFIVVLCVGIAVFDAAWGQHLAAVVPLRP